jgi:alkaline phosphatase D
MTSGFGSQAVALGQAKVTHGPIVGAVTSNSARILLRVDNPVEVRYELDTDSTFVNSLFTESKSADSEFDFFAIVDIQNLNPDTKYYYRPVLNGTPGPNVNYFRTFPEKGLTSTFTFAFGACQQNLGDENSYIGRVFPLIAQDEPRFFLQLGDWTYPDTTDNAENPMDYFNVDFSRVQSNYRSKYDPNYPMAELFRKTPLDYVYDDHDFSNDNSDMSFPGRENSLRAYREMFPHYPLANQQNGLWHKFTFGNADFFVLDTRTQRHPNQAVFQQGSTGRFFYEVTSEHLLLEGDPSIMGQLQMDWLIQELKTSSADWKFICTSVPFNPGIRSFMELALFFQGTSWEAIVQLFGFNSLVDVAISIADSWNGFAKSVERLVKGVNEADVKNVIVLSGDSHTAAIDDGANSLFPEIMAGGLDRTNSRIVALGELFGINIWSRGGQTLARGNFNSHYGRITVFGQDSVRMELVDDVGEVISSYTQPSGLLVSKVALSHAFEKQDFEDVEVGTSSSLTLILINTAADTFFVNNITSSIPEFVPGLHDAAIPPGIRRDVIISFEPQSVGTFQGNIMVESNDPQSPLIAALRGRGVQPTSVENPVTSPPDQFVLNQNHPNPFNPSTRISYQLSSVSEVELTIYNQLGQKIKTLVNVRQPAGNYLVQWDGSDHKGRQVVSGVMSGLQSPDDLVL